MTQIINTILRLVMNKLLHRGVNAGIDRALGPKAARGALSAADRAQVQAARTTAKRAKQAMRAARKLGRF